jgi:hypothetical protein
MNAAIHRLLGAITIMTAILPTSADADAPAGQYVVTAGGTGSGTVYDTKTRLTWQQTVSSTTYTWADAKTYCGLRGTSWRLPTAKELLTIVDFSQAIGPMMDPNAFPGTPSRWFWSASQVAGAPSIAWSVDFDRGSTHPRALANSLNVRCVR